MIPLSNQGRCLKPCSLRPLPGKQCHGYCTECNTDYPSAFKPALPKLREVYALLLSRAQATGPSRSRDLASGADQEDVAWLAFGINHAIQALTLDAGRLAGKKAYDAYVGESYEEREAVYDRARFLARTETGQTINDELEPLFGYDAAGELARAAYTAASE